MVHLEHETIELLREPGEEINLESTRQTVKTHSERANANADTDRTGAIGIHAMRGGDFALVQCLRKSSTRAASVSIRGEAGRSASKEYLIQFLEQI